MQANWIALATFVTATLLTLVVASLVYDWLFRYRNAIRERLAELAGDAGDGDRSVSLFKDLKQLQTAELLRRRSWKDWLQGLIDQSGLQFGPGVLLAWSVAGAGVLATLGFIRSPWLALLLTPIGASLPMAALLARRHHRQRELCRQLPEAFEMISRAIKAGQTVPAALQIIADDFEKPIATEFALCYEQQNLGMSRESALRRLAARSGVMELQIFVVALLVQARSGGDLIELLDNLALMIRKRLKLGDRVRALTGEGRMQAMVLIVLPIAAFLGIVSMAPDYASCLLERPWLLCATAIAQVAGALWIRQIVNFDY
ncbi:Bacterial type II secretion system protein F domain protein [Planctomycetes bacterium K2D]|uniref:Bacterial type II secretion system protein F domain protein n=2 Tax=Botrimarina mediterranea TaxID=2528022 RepID=A0A518KCT1_9BACT|nr:type II secretion system F family protein [Botrimarina mediterranea]QDV75601.1 Bacterial type II secretion system protein F domain protein [Botrimarina mediterranea]QDV80235.1 Bacterial type II secretion system protein F domain protein [Planctomycetes bacterium K2D]